MKKKRLLFMALSIIAVLTIGIYWFNFSKPTAFPSDEQLLQEMNRTFPNMGAHRIQDTIFVDDRHVLVPYTSEHDFGLSYWQWKNHKWQVLSIDTKGTPMLWKVDKNNPASYHFVWNIHPDDQLSSIDFYLLRDRGYSFSDNEEHYSPRVQLAKKVSLKEKSYGVMKLPEDWVTVMNELAKVDSAIQPNSLFNSFFPQPYLTFGWIPYDENRNESYPERSVNSHGYSNGTIEMEHVIIFNEEDLELP